jgi:hypothetical protein
MTFPSPWGAIKKIPLRPRTRPRFIGGGVVRRSRTIVSRDADVSRQVGKPNFSELPLVLDLELILD